MVETNMGRLERITEYVKSAHNQDATPLLNLGDLNWLIARAEQVPKLEEYIEVMSIAFGDSANDLVKSQDKYKRLVESYKELTIQENAMQNNWKLAFKSMEKYKKRLDEITAAMNTERPAEEKTKDVRRILEELK